MSWKSLHLKILYPSGVFFAVLFIFVSPSNSYELSTLVNEALGNNPDLAAAKSRFEMSTFVAPQVGSLHDPMLSFVMSNYPSDSFASNDTPMTGNEIKLSQKFPFPGKLKNRAALAEEKARWAEAVYFDKRYKVARKVKDAWYRLYFNRQATSIIERNIELVDDVIRLTEVRYETGTGLQQDVLKAQVERSRFMEQLISLQQNKETIQAEISNLLGKDSFVPFEAPANLDLISVDNSMEDFYAAKENRPLLDAYKALIKRFSYQKKLADLDDYPDVTLWGSWRFRDDDLPDKGTDFVSAGVSINLPVYREKRRAAKAEAMSATRMAEHQLRDYDNGVSKSIEKAYARMQETKKQIDLYREGIIPQATQSFQAAMAAYQVGKVEFISLLDALLATFKAELDYYRVSSEYMRSLAWLEAESTMTLIGPKLQNVDKVHK